MHWATTIGLVIAMFSINFFTNYLDDFGLPWIFGTHDCARVAVYEHVPLGAYDGSQSPRAIINLNLKQYHLAIKRAAEEGVQLMVFPEDSLINSEQYSRARLINEILEEMPSPKKGERLVNPCKETKDTSVVRAEESVLRAMSCHAKRYRMYIAFSFGDKVPCNKANDSGCPVDGHYLFNTIGLFDNKGNFVAKYHKMQLYYEFHYNIPSDCATHDSPVVYYDSPFGRLGFLICYDLMFRSPGVDLVEKYHVNTLIYSTYWFNYMPFVSAVQMQQAFAIRHKVNFLASDIQNPEDGPNVGAGIYAGTRGALIYSNAADGQSKVLIATIPTNSKDAQSSKTCPSLPKKVTISKRSQTKMINYQLNVSLVHTIPLDHALGQDFVEYCCPYSGICCSLYYRVKNVQQFHREHFVLLVGNVTSGALGQERYPIRQEFCGLAACEDSKCAQFAMESKTIFSSIDLSGKLKSKYVYPSVMTSGLGLLPVEHWKYSNDSDQHLVSIHNYQESFVAVTLYGRLYEEDPKYKH